MVESPQRIWIESGDECPYFYEAHELHDVEQDVIEYVRADIYAALEAQLAEKEAENERLRTSAVRWSLEASKYAKKLDKAREREAQLAACTGPVKVKALDEDDYEGIISAAAINMRKATSGIRGQVITVQDSLDWWVMKETERRILSVLEPAAPEVRQPTCIACDDKPIPPNDPCAVCGTSSRPAEQVVMEAYKLLLWAADSFEAHTKTADAPDEIDGCFGSAEMYREVASALKAAMEAGG